MRYLTYLFHGSILFCLGFIQFTLLADKATQVIDVQQGELTKILYLHLSVAWLSVGIYILLAISSGFYLVTKSITYKWIGESLAFTGACVTGLTLFTGMLWANQTWGTYWEWDARLTSSLILFLLYISYNKLSSEHSSLLILLGLVNIPVLKYSVNWFVTLHQTTSMLDKLAMQLWIYPLVSLILSGYCALWMIWNAYYLAKLKSYNANYKSTH